MEEMFPIHPDAVPDDDEAATRVGPSTSINMRAVEVPPRGEDEEEDAEEMAGPPTPQTSVYNIFTGQYDGRKEKPLPGKVVSELRGVWLASTQGLLI